MALPNAPGHARLAIRGHWSNGRQVVNILDMRRETGSGSWTNLTGDVRDNWQDEIIPLLMNNYTFDGIHFIELIPGGEVGDVAPDPAKPTVGGRSSAAAAPSQALLVHKQIERHRGVHTGRWYLAGVDEANCDEDGNISGSLLGDWQTALDAFWAGVDDTGSHHPSVVHQDGTADDINSFNPDSVVASQRRRVRG